MTSTVDIPAQRADTVDAPSGTDDLTPVPTGEDAAPAADSSGDNDEAAAAALTAAEREAEYFTIQWLSPGALIIGPNVRVEGAKADKATGRDYQRRGVRTPVLAYRDELGRFVVTDGQRRVLNAVDAGVEQMMVLVQPPPIDDERQADIDRIVNQLGDNDMRVEITRNDRYQAHAQLRLYGLSAAEIARQLSRPRKQIEQSLQVGDSELAAKAADKYSLTVDQAAAIAEFEGYGDLNSAKELITTAVEHPNNFNVLVRAKRAERAEDERIKAATENLTAELTAAGVLILDESVTPGFGAVPLSWLRPSPDAEPGTVLTAEDHTSCPGHAAWIKTVYDETDTAQIDAEYGCTDFRAHGHARLNAPHGTVESTPTAASRTGAPTTSPATRSAASKREELEREQSRIRNRLVRANNKLWDAAVEERRAWLAQFAQRKAAPKGAHAWLARHKLDGELELRRAMERGHKLAHQLLKLAPAGYGTRSELTERIANASAAKATVYDVVRPNLWTVWSYSAASTFVGATSR